MTTATVITTAMRGHTMRDWLETAAAVAVGTALGICGGIWLAIGLASFVLR